jgi:hypothetical protein
MSSTGNIPKDLTGICYWKRSCSGRTRSLWVYVKFAHHRQYDGKSCWLVRELIRGGVGPMHGKALRDVVVPEYVWNRRALLGEDEYTKEIYELISEATLNEVEALIPGNRWGWHAENRKDLQPKIDRLYQRFGIKQKEQVYNIFRRKQFQVDTTSGNGVQLYAEFDDQITAVNFIKQAFAMNLAQSAKLYDVTANTTRHFRKRKLDKGI